MFGVSSFEFYLDQGLMEQVERCLKSDESVSNEDADERMETKSGDDVMIPMKEIKRHDPRPDDPRYKA